MTTNNLGSPGLATIAHIYSQLSYLSHWVKTLNALTQTLADKAH